MPWESIGCTDTGRWPDEESWVRFSFELARKYIIYVCGKPPPGSELGMMLHEHDLGEYPTLGVYSDGEPPDDYIRSCEQALEVFEAAVDWSRLKHFYDERLRTDEEEE